MVIKVRNSDKKEWGFLESYSKYSYSGRGYLRAVTSVDSNGSLSPCYAFRDGNFIPLSEIEEEVGIARYIKAKKPFYSKLKEGFIVILKADVDFNKKIYYPETSTFEVYTTNAAGGIMEGCEISLKKVLNIPDEFRKLVEEPLRILGESFGDREKFLKGR